MTGLLVSGLIALTVTIFSLIVIWLTPPEPAGRDADTHKEHRA